MGTWVKYLILGLGLLISACANTNSGFVQMLDNEDEGKPLALIIGKPSKFDYLGDQDPGPGNVPWRSWYEVSFRSYDVIFGEVLEGKIKVNLLFHSLPKPNFDLFVLVEVMEDQQIKGLDWGFPKEIVCIYEKDFEYIKQKYPDGPASEKLKEFFEGEMTNCCWTERFIQ